jgi:predicted phage terminase large subunit-like protein
VCITALVTGQRVFVLDVWRRKVTFPDLKKAAIALARDQGANVVMIEDQASGTQLLQTLRNEEPQGVPRPIGRKPEADKKTRLAGVSAMIEAGQLLLPLEALWLGEFKQELLSFPSARHDDQVDALSQMLIWVDQRQATQVFFGAPKLFVGGREVRYDLGETGDDYIENEHDPWA